ncbi:MAG: oligogalacturonate lyase family protein [Acidobacteriota bacterium]|nr:oligogalacturonate lyase family protein [Acidobacteriota bacterium]
MKGALAPSEQSSFRDGTTGALVHRITNHPSINHPAYFLQSSFTPDNRHILFTSYRTGSPQLFEAGFPGGDIRQLTDGPPIHPFSPAIHPEGELVYFVRGGSIWSIHRGTLKERLIVDFPGAQLGECSLGGQGKWLTAALKQGGKCGVVVGQADGSGWHLIPFERTVIHPQFHPLDPGWLIFAGDPAPRIHRVRQDGSGLECMYQHSNDEFVVHETFLGDTGDLVFVVWPFSLNRMNWRSLDISPMAAFNAWHIAANGAGTKVLCDTNHPDRGLFLIDVSTGARTQICESGSSNQGSQWRTSRYAVKADFEAANSAAQSNLSWMETPTDSVYGPQWTHPHPSFSHDEKLVAFASDRTGHAQVYVAEIG